MTKTTVAIDDRQMKQAVKEVLREKLAHDPRWLREVIAEVLEDAALVAAIRHGRTSKFVARAAVFRALEGKK